MAYKNNLARSLFHISKNTLPSLPSCRITSSAAKHLPPEPGVDIFSRRFLHRRPLHPAYDTGKYSELRTLPSGELLMEKLRETYITSERIRLDGLKPPVTEKEEEEEGKLTVEDARKLLRAAQMGIIKEKLLQMEKDCISYAEFKEICAEICWNEDQAKEMVKMLDQSTNVIVLGNVVFLRPQQVVKAIQALMPIAMTHPSDHPSFKELATMEKQKATIDRQATALVRRELWCGLGYLIIQTAVFMRLTFWELSWDIMEPICFYVTSIYFMTGYAFFLKTSKEPSFEGLFESRFSSKQKQLMKLHNFDVQRYNELQSSIHCYTNGGTICDCDTRDKEKRLLPGSITQW